MTKQRLIPLRRTEAENPLSAKGIRNEYLNFGTMTDEELLEKYRNWRQEPIWLIFQEQETRKIIAIRGMKRGDRKHAWKAGQSFDRAIRMKDLVIQQQRTKSSPARTNTLWISATYDGKTGSEAYSYIGKDFNRFKSALEKAYGKVQVIRVWESQERGTPHWHAIIIFLEKTWSWEWRRRRNNRRMSDPRIFGHKEIKKYWKHGFSDVKAVHDYEGALRYIKKYLTKQLESKEKKDDLACAHQMVYGNHTYHVPSNKNIERLLKSSDLITPISNSNSQTEKESITWRFMGTFSSYEPLHRTEIFRIHTKEEVTDTHIGSYTITAVEYLFHEELPYTDGLTQSTLGGM
jgi:Bacteriophage replication gene A protein (GPA).